MTIPSLVPKLSVCEHEAMDNSHLHITRNKGSKSKEDTFAVKDVSLFVSVTL